MAQTFTIRNLTSTPITIKLIETFEDPKGTTSNPNAFPRNHNSTPAPSGQKLSDHVKSYCQQDLNVSLPPFQSYNLSNSSTLSPTSTIRLTLVVRDDEKHRIDIASSSNRKRSQPFTPLTPKPSLHLIGLYHPSAQKPHLSIHTAPELDSWMSSFEDIVPLPALSIPGTHNSHTYHRALPSVRCQVHSVSTQLTNGIRFLDIRVQPYHATDLSKRDLIQVHGAFPVSLTGPKYLDPLIKTCYDFLEKHPSETVMLSLKREGAGNATDQHLSQILEKHYVTPNAERWYTSPKIPSLGEVRGKLVLIRRFALHESLRALNDGAGWGLDAECWAYNATHDLHGLVCVQDFCEVLETDIIAQKILHCNAHLDRAAECVAHIPGMNTDKENPVPPGPLYLNFTSGSNFWRRGCWPEKIAKRLNPAMLEYLCVEHHQSNAAIKEQGEADEEEDKRQRDGDGGTGIVVMDWVGDAGDWDIVKVIIGMNAGLLAQWN